MCRIVRTSLLCLFLYFSFLPESLAGSYIVSEEQLQVLENHLIQLETNTEMLSEELTMSKSDLTIALKALASLQEQYSQAKADLATVKQSLTIADNELQNVREYVKTLEKHQQKNHDIKLGALYVYNDIYGSLSYRNRRIEYILMYAKSGKAGAGVQVTLAEW